MVLSETAKLLHVDAEALVVETDGVPSGNETIARQRLLERRQRAPERGARSLLVVLRPQQTGESVTAHGSLGNGNIGEHGQRFTRVDLDDRAVPFDAGGAE
jgi:hypothetical protein